jgi:hypothetical protein
MGNAPPVAVSEMISVNSCDVAVLECLRAARAMSPILLGPGGDVLEGARRTPRRSCPLLAAVVLVAAGHASADGQRPALLG